MSMTDRLHWTTRASEKILLASIGILTMLCAMHTVYGLIIGIGETQTAVALSDLFLLFIYAEIIGMVGAFYSSHRIPVTLPIIIAITALCRLIILHSKDMEGIQLLAESGAILILSGATYVMSLKDKLSLEKEQIRER